MLSHRHAVLLLSAIILCMHGVHAYKHDLKISKDSRRNFFIENFGFAPNGKMSMDVTKFSLHGKKESDYQNYELWKNQIYFLVRNTQIDSTEYLAEIDYSCDPGSQSELMVDPSVFTINQDWRINTHWEKTVDPTATGLYNLYFVNCKHTELSVSFELRLDQYNIDPSGEKDYLPKGLSPLPTIYAAFSVVYVIMFVIWIVGYMRGAGQVVNKVHYLMSVLIVLKFFSLFFYAIEQHFVKIDGRPGGWEYAYYIFAVLKTLFFFVIITLIGTGWSFFKPFLSDRDKKIIMVVVPLQVLDNVAMVIVGSTAPGSTGWFTWKDIFRLVDIICCGAILIPIIWSIKHLREASQIDGKAARNLQKLRLFRQFYLIVVSYIYFTRIIIYLLDATLQYYLIYLGDVFTELATLCFFVVVGHKFRPTQGNPYFNLEEEDAARSEEMRAAVEED